MFIQIKKQKNQYVRLSKLGNQHNYARIKTLAIFKCDNCDQIFERDLKKIDRKRLSNNYFHCCSNCDTKRFAQRTGVEHKKIWDIPSDADLDISKL
jgi:hypothetical protein